MLSRIYVDNYKCLANFEFSAEQIQLISGTNGSGKSTLFDAVVLLRTFMTEGRTTSELFKPETLTRWDSSNIQKFELVINGNGGYYRYRLEVYHNTSTSKSQVKEEVLSFNEQVLFSASKGRGRLFHDILSQGPTTVINWERSGISLLGQHPVNKRFTWFKDRIAKIYCIRLNPCAMSSRSEHEVPYPSVDTSDFVSWYRHLSQAKTDDILQLFKSLRNVLDGFESLSLVESSENVRTLTIQVKMKPTGKDSLATFNLDFNEISDGKRALIVLYTLLHCCENADATLFIDEPDNYIATEELQPWLMALSDKVLEGSSQALLISHHPELLNYLARDCGVWFQRELNSLVRIKSFPKDSDNGLSASEEVARSNIDE